MPEHEAKPRDLFIEVCAIDRAPYKMKIKEAAFPGALGLFVVLPGHAPMFSSLEPGVLVAKNVAGQSWHFATGGGLMRVLDNNIVVLTRTAELDADIDRQRAQEAKQRARERLKSSGKDIDKDRAEAALRRAEVRLNTLALSEKAEAENP